jgi:hypothetical protein
MYFVKRCAWLSVLTVVLLACGEKSVIGPDEFHRVAGGYTGAIEGATSVGSFSGVVLLSLSQSDGALTGTYDFNGDIYHTEHATRYYQGGSGTVEGSLGSGPRPQVSLTFTPDDCPARVMSYQGTYDHGPRQMRVSGSLLLSTDSCDPLVTVSHSMVLQRD